MTTTLPPMAAASAKTYRHQLDDLLVRLEVKADQLLHADQWDEEAIVLTAKLRYFLPMSSAKTRSHWRTTSATPGVIAASLKSGSPTATPSLQTSGLMMSSHLAFITTISPMFLRGTCLSASRLGGCSPLCIQLEYSSIHR